MNHDLRIERLIDGTPEEVFDAFTDPAAMLEWFREGPDWTVEVVACDVRIGGTTIVEFGSTSQGWRCREEMTYSVVERPKRLVYAELFGGGDESFNTTVSLTFEPQDGKTLITLVQTDFPNAEERDAHQGGWPGFLDRLEQAVLSRRASA